MTKTQARVLLPNRGQMELRASDLESLLCLLYTSDAADE